MVNIKLRLPQPSGMTCQPLPVTLSHRSAPGAWASPRAGMGAVGQKVSGLFFGKAQGAGLMARLDSRYRNSDGGRLHRRTPAWQGYCDGRIKPSAVDALCAETDQIWSAPMAKLHHSGIAQETALRQAAVIRGMMHDLGRTIQFLDIDISTEEERGRIFDRSDPAYPILARTLTARRDNLIVTVADLEERLRAIIATIPAAIPEAA
jgi:hypothetical protein